MEPIRAMHTYFVEEAGKKKETADLSARRFRLLGNIKAFAIIQRPRSFAGNSSDRAKEYDSDACFFAKVESHDSILIWLE